MRNLKKVLGLFLAFMMVLGFVPASKVEASGRTAIYRVYNPNSGEHLFTPNRAEVGILVNKGWRDEGTAWYNDAADLNVYRMYNPNSGDHFYTADTNEFKHLKTKGWRDDKYILPSNSGGIPVYRLYNPNAKTGYHHYTLNSNERDMLKKAGWRYEGVAFYATATSKIGTEFTEDGKRCRWVQEDRYVCVTQ